MLACMQYGVQDGAVRGWIGRGADGLAEELQARWWCRWTRRLR